MIRTFLVTAIAACALGACADYYDPAYNDSPSYGGPRYKGEVYYGRGDDGYRRRDNDWRDNDWRDGRRDRDFDRNRGREQRMTIEDAQYESVNGRRIDAKRYVRDECQGENNCDVKASNKVFGDPDVGAHKDLIVRYRCGRGPTRTVRIPEKSEEDIRC